MVAADQPAPRTRFRRGFALVSKNVLREPSLPMNAKACYALLCTYADDAGICWPSAETLAEDLGVDKRTVFRLLALLQDRKVLTRIDRFDDNRQTTSLSVLNDAESTWGDTDATLGGVTNVVQNKTTMKKTSRPRAHTRRRPSAG